MASDLVLHTRAWARRWYRIFMLLLLLATILGGTGFLIVGRHLEAPDWLREEIEQRLADAMPGLAIDFGQMGVVVQRSGQARVILWDVQVTTTNGQQVASLSDIEAGFSPLSLLVGQFAAREVQVSGAFLTLQRDRDGRFGLALGDVFSAQTEAPDLPQIVAQVDQLFSDPRLSKLQLFEADALTLRFEDTRARRGWTADGGRVRLARKDDILELSGDLALLGGGAGVSTLEVNAQSRIGDNGLSFGVVLGDFASRDIATQSPALAWLDALDAQISGALRSTMSAEGELGALHSTLQISEGVLQPNLAARPLPFDAARAYLTYHPQTGDIVFDEIFVTSPMGEVSANGAAQLGGVAGGWPTNLAGQFSLSDIAMTKGAVLDRAVAVSGAEMAFKLDLDPFQLRLGELRLTDPDLPITASGTVVATQDGWDLSLDAHGDQTNVAQVLSYWPVDFKPRTRNWVATNVSAGTLHDVDFALRAGPSDPVWTFLDFGFSGGKVRVNPNLPAIDNGIGRLTLNGPRLGLTLEQGRSTPQKGGTLDLAGSTFVVADLRKKPANARISLRADGPLTAALSYIDNPKWRVLGKVGRDADMAQGRAALRGTIALPLKKGLRLPDIAMDLKGTARDVTGGGIVKGRTITAKALDFAVTNAAVSVSGPVVFDGIPADARWQQPLSNSSGALTAKVRLSPKSLAAIGVKLPNGMMSGQGTGQLEVDLPRGGDPTFALSSDLAGIGLSIAPLNWRLGQKTKGSFRVSGALGKDVRIERLALKAGGLDATGTLSLGAGGKFDRLNLDKLSLGNWLDVRANIIGRGNAAPRVEIASGSVDMRRAKFGGGEGGGAEAGPMQVRLDRLQVTDSIWLSGFQGDFEGGAGLRGKFSGKLGGKAAINGRVVPQNGRSAVRVEGRDAGDILKAAGILKTVSDGTFKMDLAPVRGTTGSYDGELAIRGTRLRDAPAIGALLDAISIVGLLDQLNGPGIFFSEVDAKFRLTPNQVIVSESSAVGPSMGISLDGYYDLGSGRMDMQGVLSPIYIINGIGRLIARKGEGLIGFNFNLRGAVSKPQVLVNPLSVFTPGMFRDIFRRPPPNVSQ